MEIRTEINNRFLAIDLIKAIAMIMVLALHTGVQATFLPNSICQKLVYCTACIAVPLFYMASGYILSNKQLNWSYAKRKIRGILKFVFLTTTFFLIGYYIFDYIAYGHCTAPFFRLYTYFTWIIQAGITWHYWYFGPMIIIYAVCPWLAIIIQSKHLGKIICILFFISFSMFIIDYYYHYESKYIPGTFRLYYWFMYFLIGAYIRKNHHHFKFVGWPLAISVGICYAIYQLLAPQDLGKGFHFGTLSSVIYTSTIFIACTNTKINNKNTFISNISALFLPVYSLHIYLYNAYDFMGNLFLHYLEPNLRCIITLIIYITLTIIICWGLVKIPIFNKIFRI